MKLLKFSFSIILLFLSAGIASAQKPCLTALLLKKGHELKIRENMTTVDDNGFYLYRNCMYNIEITGKKKYSARLLDVRPDTLIFQSHLNARAAKKFNQTLDTLRLAFKDLSKIYLVADRSLGMQTNISLKNYELIVKPDSANCSLPIQNIQIFSGDSTYYEVLPILTQQGLDYLFEDGGKEFYYRGVIQRAKRKDSIFIKRAISVLPGMDDELDEVNGVTLDFVLFGTEADTLKLKGFVLELLPLGWFGSMFGSFLGKDSSVFQMNPNAATVITKGFYLSVGGCVTDAEINGFYIGGAMTTVNSIKGVSITGVHTRSYVLKGVSISALRNQTKVGRGVQISLFNSGMNFKGIQIGLWNKNQKRSLPFVNWNLKD